MKRRRLVLSGMTGVTVAVLPLAGAWIAGSRLTAPCPRVIGALPADLQGREVELASGSGSKLRGWWVPGRTGAGALVLLHGVRANRLAMLDRARFLNRAGYSVCLFDFQAHGESTGEQITFGYLESRDAQAAVNFVRRSLPGEKVGALAVSMGGAAALLASPPLEVDAMVLEEVYPSIDRAIANRLQTTLGSGGRYLAPALSLQLRPRLGLSIEDLSPILKIGQVTVPKLLIAGAEDRHTLLAESQALFEAAKPPKELWVVEGAGHANLHRIAGAEYERRVLGFFGATLRR